jgi:hypothetical protein
MIAVDVNHVSALAPIDEQWLAAHRAKGAHWGVDATREDGLSLGEKLDRAPGVEHCFPPRQW